MKLSRFELLIIIAFGFCTMLGLIFSCNKKEVIIEEKVQTSSLRSQRNPENEILIQFKKENQALLIAIGGNIIERVRTRTMEIYNDPGFLIVNVPSVGSAMKILSGHQDVNWISPNYKLEAIQTYPNDPYFTNGSLWGMKNIGADKVWPYNKGSQKIYIGVIDEGVFFCHNDLNGQIDVPHSYDFYHNDNTIFDGTDDHGTHVDGTIGAIGNNSLGVIGISPYVTIVQAKFLENTGTTDAAIKAIDYITSLKLDSGLNIVATNNSWGGGEYSQGLKDAITRAGQANILFVAAAGNASSNTDSSPNYPSCYDNDNIISVAAITSTDGLASFSNYGATTVDIGAPGNNIYSTLFGSSGESTYGSYSGTSMATPHVTGAAALYAASHPGATYQQIKSAILNAARPIAALTGKCVTSGTLNISSFTQSYSETPVVKIYPCTAAPNPPVNVTTTLVNDTQLGFSWQKPADPDNIITGYEATLTYSDGRSTILTTSNLSITFSNLPPGYSFNFSVKSIGNNGFKSQPSAALPINTSGSKDIQASSIPQNFKQEWAGFPSDFDSSTMLGCSWLASSDNYLVSGYYIDVRYYGHTSWDGRTWKVNWTAGPGQLMKTYLISVSLTGGGSWIIPATWYEARIRSYDNSLNQSANSGIVLMHTTGAQPIDTIITPPPPPPPSPPPTDTIPPTITLTTMNKGRWNIQINSSAYDNVQVAKIDIAIDNSIITSCYSSTCSYMWNTRNANQGYHTITATATDTAGNKASKSINIYKN